jgi:chromosome segregation ATPase
MKEPEAEQFLDLIAENAQIKAEIISLKRFGGTLRLFDRTVIRMCADEVSGEENRHSDLNTLISQIRLGVSPVESAESFKQRMIAERTRKRSEIQQEKLTAFKERLSRIESKQKDITDAVLQTQAKIDEHQRIISESHAIKENFVKQIDLMTATIESLKQSRSDLSDRIARAQAAGIEIRRRIEQTHRTLTEFTQNESTESRELTSIRRIVGDLRSQMKSNAS